MIIFDNEEQKALILQMFDQINFPGPLIDLAYQTKQAVKGAQVGASEESHASAPGKSGSIHFPDRSGQD